MPVNGVGSSNSTTNSTTQTRKDIMDKDVFLKILTVQLSNQDPLNPKDNTEYIAQLAQFTSLEQSKNLNTSMDKLILSQKFASGNALIGQNVELNIDNKSVIETVKGVKINSGNVYLVTNNGERNIDDVISSTPSASNINNSIDKLLLSQRFNEGTFLIGSKVDFNIDNQAICELVTGVKIVNGSVYLVTENGQRNIENVVGVNIPNNTSNNSSTQTGDTSDTGVPTEDGVQP